MNSMAARIRTRELERYGFGTGEMKKIKICASCGTKTSAWEEICPGCRSRLPEETLYEQYKKRHSYCSNCDTVVRDGTEYCPGCGRKIKKNN